MTKSFYLSLVTAVVISSCGRHSKSESQALAQQPSNTDTTEIDFAKVSADKCKVLLENEYVRVIEYSLKPGEKDTPHTHPPKSAYVLSGGTVRVYPEGEKPFDAVETQGTVEWAGYRGKHYVENIGNTTVTILLTEVKAARRK